MYKLGTALSVITDIKERSIDQVTNKARLRIKLERYFKKLNKMKLQFVFLSLVITIICLQCESISGSPTCTPVCQYAGDVRWSTCCLFCLNCRGPLRGFSLSKCNTWCAVSYFSYPIIHKKYSSAFIFALSRYMR